MDDLTFDALFPRRARIETHEEKYMPPLEIIRGVILAKGGMGSGKTEMLARALAQRADAQDNCGPLKRRSPTRVLLIGYRRTLITEACARLGLECYLDADSPGHRFGVCLDSITRLRDELPYHVVVLDESEQVIAHLASDTLQARREKCFNELVHQVSVAQTVIALDADLGVLTCQFLKGVRKDWDNAKVIYNRGAQSI